MIYLSELLHLELIVLSFLRTLPNDSESKLIRFQLGKSTTSIGTNYEESQAGSSKADFKNLKLY